MIDLEEFLTNLNLPTEPPEYSPCQSMDGFPDDRPPNRQARLRQRGISLNRRPLMTEQEFRYHYEGQPYTPPEEDPNG